MNGEELLEMAAASELILGKVKPSEKSEGILLVVAASLSSCCFLSFLFRKPDLYFLYKSLSHHFIQLLVSE